VVPRIVRVRVSAIPAALPNSALTPAVATVMLNVYAQRLRNSSPK
jgi:hypothetical protein